MKCASFDRITTAFEKNVLNLTEASRTAGKWWASSACIRHLK